MNENTNNKSNINNKDDIDIRAMIAASGQVLCQHLPFDFNDRDDDEMDQFVIEHAWEPFEGWPAKMIWTQINDVASALKSFHQSEVKLSKQ